MKRLVSLVLGSIALGGFAFGTLRAALCGFLVAIVVALCLPAPWSNPDED
jgi:F0F1-type ATP synthase assembly protein I